MRRILNKIVWLVIGAPALYLGITWNRLPEIIAMHFDLQGHVDRYGNKKELIGLTAIFTAMNIFVYFLLTNIYRIDPKRYAAENKERLNRIAFAVAVFLAALLCLLLSSSRQGTMKFSINFLLSGMGLLFAIIGNYMPNLKPNYFAGLRLPWTLENEENWRRTHILAGKLWFAGGLLLAMICIFLKPVISLILFFTVMTTITVIPCVFSYKLFVKQKRSSLPGPNKE